MGDLLQPEALQERRLKGILEWKNLTLAEGVRQQAGHALRRSWEWLETYGEPCSKPYVCDAGIFLDAGGKRTARSVLFEAQLGALRDIDFGIYPFTSSSNTIAAYAPIGSRVSRTTSCDNDCRRHEGLLHLRRRGPVHLRVVRRGGRKAACRPAANTARRPGRPRRVGPL